MTRDDIIKWAREAGWTSYDSQDERFERFAKLVYEKAWADTALAATHTVTDAAIAKEREACAKVCEDFYSIEGIAQQCAKAIRGRNP